MTSRSVLCPGTDCKKRDKCLLYTTPPMEKYQAYFTMACSIKVVDDCRWFASNEENTVKQLDKLSPTIHNTNTERQYL